MLLLVVEELVEEEEVELLVEEVLSFRAVGARVLLLLEVELASRVLVTVTPPLKNLSILEVAFWKPSLRWLCLSDVVIVVVRPPGFG